MAKPTRERRQHKRHPLQCPARLADEVGVCLVAGKTIDISDGGMMMPVAQEAPLKPGRHLSLKLSVPRSTPNTFLMESIASEGIVVRHVPAEDGTHCLAIRFAAPLTLDLEV